MKWKLRLLFSLSWNRGMDTTLFLHILWSKTEGIKCLPTAYNTNMSLWNQKLLKVHTRMFNSLQAFVSYSHGIWVWTLHNCCISLKSKMEGIIFCFFLVFCPCCMCSPFQNLKEVPNCISTWINWYTGTIYYLLHEL